MDRHPEATRRSVIGQIGAVAAARLRARATAAEHTPGSSAARLHQIEAVVHGVRLRVLRRALRALQNGDGTCHARCRDGHECRAPRVAGRARCKLHGGLSTGPRTPEGKARSLAALRRAA